MGSNGSHFKAVVAHQKKKKQNNKKNNFIIGFRMKNISVAPWK